MGKGPLELEGCPCIFAQGPPSSKLRHWRQHGFLVYTGQCAHVLNTALVLFRLFPAN